MKGLYVHIPFCLKKCKYCSFYSLSGKFDEEKYLSSLFSHLDFLLEKFSVIPSFDTLYFGGGTPSLISLNFFDKFFVKLSKVMDISNFKEITIEANPETLSREYLKGLKDLGFNRLSIGVQSVDNDILKKLGRIHSVEKALKSVENVLDFFENVSVDFIIGIKGQENKSVEEIFDFPYFDKIKHVSVYMLEGEKNETLKVDDDFSANLYLETVNYLESAGFERYEISNFAKDGYKSVHNSLYWSENEFLGIGVSAHSFVFKNETNEGIRFSENSDFRDFLEKRFDVEENFLEKEQLIREFFMLGLRKKEGIDLKSFSDFWKIDAEKYFSPVLNKFSDFFEFESGRVFLSLEGVLVSNEIFEEILFFENGKIERKTGDRQ